MELIITEKPSSAKKIAEAIADGKPGTKKHNGVTYFEFTAEGKDVAVVSAVGHLYTVTEADKQGWTYPVFDTKWVPSADASKDAAYSRKYLTLIKKLAKQADTITIATDFDVEGEVIGYTIMRYACGRDDAQRMKFSTVTDDELRESYASKQDHIAWGQANAGVTRHELDWYYGINLSRALTLAVKKAGRFKILSSGRVQSPALKLLADKDAEIKAFIPEPYWELVLHTDRIDAGHEKGRFTDKNEATTSQSHVTDTAVVEAMESSTRNVPPPHPFDLTTLQTEAYRSFGMKPKETLGHAQDLYSAGYISYPRTSSQQLPPSIGYKKVLTAIGKQPAYKELAAFLLAKGTLKPNDGKKTDPAHPAIYPTGVFPQKMRDRARNVYDIIVRRFLSTFADAVVRETITARITSGGEGFQAKGTRTIEQGWHAYYGSHVKLKEEEVPPLKEGQQLSVKDCELIEKETQPPRRYTPSSIIKELEKRGLGTKATRADIIENLYSRGYIKGDSIEVTEIGQRTIQTLAKHVPDIVDEKLTIDIEEELEGIREGKQEPEKVLAHARAHLTRVLDEFKENEMEIGKELLEAQREDLDTQTLLGNSPKEEEGMLQIKRSRFGLFVGSTNYPDCKSTFKIPTGMVTPARKRCPWCSYPLVDVVAKRRGKSLVCFNYECPSRAPSEDAKTRAEEVLNNEIPCEKGGHLILRQGPYGPFIASDQYPKIRYTENIESVGQADKERWKQAEEIPDSEFDDFVEQRAAQRAEEDKA